MQAAAPPTALPRLCATGRSTRATGIDVRAGVFHHRLLLQAYPIGPQVPFITGRMPRRGSRAMQVTTLHFDAHRSYALHRAREGTV
jgi:hypothetical protein